MNDTTKDFVVAGMLPDIEYTTDAPEEVVSPRVVVRDGVAKVYIHTERHEGHGGHVPVETFLGRLAAGEPGLMVTGYRKSGKQTTISFNKRNRVKLSARLRRFLAELTEAVRDAGQLEAARIISELLPDAQQRAIVLGQLLRSADFANSVAPDAWAVTLFADGFRLNVGQVECLIFTDGSFLRVLLAGSVGTPPFVGARFVARQYRSVLQPQCEFFGNIEEFESTREQIQQSHMDFIRLAATTKSGKSRAGSPHLRSHSSGLLAYAKEFLHGIDGGAVDAPTAEEDIAHATDLPEQETERQTVIAARRGQGVFRARLDGYWSGCAITGCATRELLRASHIRPWRESSNRDRLNPDNGLLLAAHLDAAFDQGLISFADDGRILLHARLPTADAQAIGITATMRLRRVRPGHLPFLARHRELHGFAG